MNSKPLLVVSLIANVGLLGAFGYFLTNRPAATEVVVKEAPRTNSAPVLQKIEGRVITVTNALETKFDWRAAESDNYKEYIANLRSIGCPEETIRDIIIADVNKLFESRKKSLNGGKQFEFWKSGNMFSAMVDEEAIKKKQELAKEKKALIKELLGIDVEEAADFAAIVNPLTTMLDFLPEDKQAKISEMMQSFQAKAMKSLQGGAPDAEDMKEMMKVQKEFETELAKLLTPQEYDDYQLRLSQTAMMMRMQLGSFEPSEQEFRDIFKLRKEFDDNFGVFGTSASTKEEREQKAAAEKAMKEQIKTLLGEARYADYTRAQDWNYQGIVKLTERNGLGREAATEVYEMDKLSKEQIRQVQDNKEMDATKRDEVVKSIKEETQNSIRNVLGEKAYEAYTNRPGFRF